MDDWLLGVLASLTATLIYATVRLLWNNGDGKKQKPPDRPHQVGQTIISNGPTYIINGPIYIIQQIRDDRLKD